MAGKQPMYPHQPGSKPVQFPHLLKGGRVPQGYEYPTAFSIKNGKAGLIAPLKAYGIDWLLWRVPFAERELNIVIGPVDFPRLIMQSCFLNSEAYIEEAVPNVMLPFQGLGPPEVPPSAIFSDDKHSPTLFVAITEIRGLSGDRIEYGFRDAIAEVVVKARR